MISGIDGLGVSSASTTYLDELFHDEYSVCTAVTICQWYSGILGRGPFSDL